MAQTWPATRARRAAIRVLDALGYLVSAPARWVRKPPPDSSSIRRILVIEPWNIGDIVLVTPLLTKLRERFPGAWIALLGKTHAVEILRDSALVDEVLVCDIPWTRTRGKYRLSLSDAGALASIVRRLRRERFDLTLDARGDPRSSLLAALSGAPRRVGYDRGGGWLLTDALDGDPDAEHKTVDWLRLLDAIVPAAAETPRESANLLALRVPTLRVSEDELRVARAAIGGAGVPSGPVIGFHPGGSHPGKRWPLEMFAELCGQLRSRFGARVVVFREPDRIATPAQWPADTVFVEGGLRSLMASLKCCDLLVCNDSGPMHLADALGVPVVAIFEQGNPKWYGPSGPRSSVLKGEQAAGAYSTLPSELPPRNPVPIRRVYDAAAKTLRDLGFAERADAAAHGATLPRDGEPD